MEFARFECRSIFKPANNKKEVDYINEISVGITNF